MIHWYILYFVQDTLIQSTRYIGIWYIVLCTMYIVQGTLIQSIRYIDTKYKVEESSLKGKAFAKLIFRVMSMFSKGETISVKVKSCLVKVKK